MIPVDQLYIHGESDVVGDCFRASIASILELPCDAVPHFEHLCPDAETGEDANIMLNLWLEQFGLRFFEIEAWDIAIGDFLRKWLVPCGYHTISGPSPRAASGENYWHACVGYAGEVVHDPHPSRAGLVGSERSYGVFIAVSPEKYIPYRRRFFINTIPVPWYLE